MRSIDKKEKVHTTPLFSWQQNHGARMAVFGIFQLPLWYKSGAKAEHLAALETAALFDTCHMSFILIQGNDSFPLLQHYFSRDLTCCRNNKPLSPGTGVYGVFLSNNGHLIDDAIIFRLEDSQYLICVNSGKGHKICSHLSKKQRWADCRITDLSAKIAKIDLQGPASALILAKLIRNPAKVLNSFPYFSSKGHFDPASQLASMVRLHSGQPILLCRSGYTGEFGFELLIESKFVVELWRQILIKGQQYGIKAAGLAARDSLRTGAVLPLAGQDIGDWPFINTPWDFALPHLGDESGFNKSFVGDQALLNSKNKYFTYPFTAFNCRKIEPGPETIVQNKAGANLGTVTTCVTDMAIDRFENNVITAQTADLGENFKVRGLSCGFVRLNSPIEYGSIVIIKDKRREIQAEIVKDIRPGRTARMKTIKYR